MPDQDTDVRLATAHAPVARARHAMAGPRATTPSWFSLLVAQTRYQLKVSLRNSRTITSSILLPVLILIALRSTSGAGLGSINNQVLVAGALVYGAISMAYLSHATALVTAREKGVLKRFRGSPLPSWIYFTGRIITTTVLAVLASLVALELAVDIVGISFPWARLGWILLGLMIGSLVWAALGTMMSGVISTPDSAWSTLITTFLPLMFISGIFIPTSTEPVWLADIANWLPAEPFGDFIQHCLSGPLVGLPRDLLVLAGWLVVSSLAARWTFKWLPVTRKRRKATRKA
ncbi:MAG TPA: ABC transporter permease [Pseudonocardiaceae bacterium]|nr:ABC transporter permease [Pseudonocardiaceae bacterium]